MPRADRRGLQTESVLGPAPLDGDPGLVERLVANLVENAVHHNVPGGSVRIATAVEDGHAVLTVTNSGPVVPPGEPQREYVHLIYESVVRIDGNGKASLVEKRKKHYATSQAKK